MMRTPRPGIQCDVAPGEAIYVPAFTWHDVNSSHPTGAVREQDACRSALTGILLSARAICVMRGGGPREAAAAGCRDPSRMRD
jgi:hypothetical protein